MFQDMFSSRDKQKIKWKKSERNKKKKLNCFIENKVNKCIYFSS